LGAAGTAAAALASSVVDTPAKSLRDWLFTIPFLLSFGLLLGVFDPLQRVARLFGQRPQEFTVGALQTGLVWAFRICGTKLEVERSPEVQPWSPYLLIANHQSLFDIPIFGSILFSNFPKYVSKRELARWIPSISYNLRRGGNAIIDRKDRAQALGEIRALGRRVAERNVSAVIYPEGTRSRNGELGPFRPGGTLELLEAAPAVAVVPVTIDDSWKLLRHNLLPVPYGIRVRVRIGAPIARTSNEDRAALLAQARSEIQGTLESWRKADAGLRG
jgi:1-acyl-sn-glycerol-3-phosphate acyltransferase